MSSTLREGCKLDFVNAMPRALNWYSLGRNGVGSWVMGVGFLVKALYPPPPPVLHAMDASGLLLSGTGGGTLQKKPSQLCGVE